MEGIGGGAPLRSEALAATMAACADAAGFGLPFSVDASFQSASGMMKRSRMAAAAACTQKCKMSGLVSRPTGWKGWDLEC